MSGTTLRLGKLTLLSFACLFLFVVTQSIEECDKSKCPGPLAYYDSLECKPVYEKPGDCCAVRYDCSNLNGRSTHKCYVNNHVYAIGERLKDEDANPCDVGCTCLVGYDDIATFNCAVVDCFEGPTKPGCYRKNSPADCCPGAEVCPSNPDDRAECNVNGKIYRDGEYFTDVDNPNLSCVCMPDYKGKNIEPFCKAPNRPYCAPQPSDVVHNCAPVYYSNQSPQTSCSVFSRCQNANDTVIHNENSDAQAASDDMKCKFGNFTMQIGDELNQATDYSSVCVKCVCEVPPTPTCQRLPDEECDVTNHPPFQH